MSRRLAPLGSADMAKVSHVCAGCVFWESAELQELTCGSVCDEDRQREWFRAVHEQWGECGRAAWEEDEVLGFIKYAPAGFFPQAALLSLAGPPREAPLITCMHIHDDARRHGLGRLLLHAALRDLHARGERRVYAYGLAQRADMTTMPMVGMEFLMRHGFTVDRPHPTYPLMRLDLRSLAVIAENLESVLDSLRIPLLRRLPTPSID